MQSGIEGLRCHLGNDDLKSGKHVLSLTPGQSASVGVPRSLGYVSYQKCCPCGSAYLNILNISSISESPGNRGFRVHISANMHPTDHMSTPVEY